MNQMIRTSDIALEPRPFPAWARHFASQNAEARTETTHATAIEAGFAAGAGIAALDAILRLNAPWTGALRHRLALSAAAATVGTGGRVEDELSLRDAWLLRRAGDDPGPAGRMLAAWRLLASTNPMSIDPIHAPMTSLGIKRDATLDQIIAAAQGHNIDRRTPVIAAAEIAADIFKQRPDAEHFGYWLADAVLAKHLRWSIAVPLLASQVHHASLKRGGRRVKPGEPEWLSICCLAYARAAAQAHDLAMTLSRRSEKLIAVAPKLRAKESASVVSALLADDAITASSVGTTMSDRGLRRLFDRLVEQDAIRELSGRPTFRIYGL